MADNQAEQPAANQSTAAHTTKKPSKNIWGFVIKIVVGLVIFALLVFGFAFFFTRGAASAADDIIADLQAGNCEELYDQTTEAFQEFTTAEDWSQSCETIYPILQGEPDQRSVQTSTDSSEGNSAQVVYHIVGTDDIKYAVGLILVDEDGWKLEGLQSEGIEDLSESSDTDADQQSLEEQSEGDNEQPDQQSDNSSSE